MKKLLLPIIMLIYIFIGFNLYASKIQQQGIKTGDECIAGGATLSTCLPLASQVWVDSLIIPKQLSSLFSSLTLTAGGILYTDGTKFVNAGAGLPGQTLIISAGTLPIWSSPAAINIGIIDSSAPSSNGLAISNGTLFAQSATLSNPGLINNTNQDIGGNKKFAGSVIVGNDGSIAIGYKTFVHGYNSSALGSYSVALNSNSSAVGGDSIATGNITVASGLNSSTFGFGTLATSFNSHAIGSYNVGVGANISGTTPTDSIFEIGIGTIGVPANAMTVLKNGNVGIGTTTPQSSLVVIGGVVFGDGTSVAIPGIYGSIAAGRSTTASGFSSFAAGVLTTASSGQAFATGYGTTASGLHSTAMGLNTIANNDNSTAMGNATTASGSESTAMGYNTAAIGIHSTAMGYNTSAIGDNSTAMGFGSVASGQYSFAIGYNTTASGAYSTAMGSGSVASGQDSFAIGSNTTASGDYSIAMGRDTISGPYGIASGVQSHANGNSSIALGNRATANGSSSIALGNYINANSYSSTAIGYYNVGVGSNTGSVTSTDSVFEIGIGTDILPANAMTVLKNGNVGIGTTTPQYALDVSTGTINAAAYLVNGGNMPSPQGTLCGLYNVSLLSTCNGSDPSISCPAGYTQKIATSFTTCVAN